MPGDLGQVGSAYIEIQARSNVKPGIAQAAQEAKQEAERQAVGWEQMTQPQRLQFLQRELYGRNVSTASVLQMVRSNVAPPGFKPPVSQDRAAAIEQAGADMLARREARDAADKRGIGEGTATQAWARFFQSDAGRRQMDKEIHEGKLALDAQRKIDFLKLAKTSGVLEATLADMGRTLGGIFSANRATFAAGGMIAAGAYAVNHFAQSNQQRQFEGAGFAAPTQAWFLQQRERDRKAIEGRQYIPQMREQEERLRDISIGLIQLQREGGTFNPITQNVTGFFSNIFDKIDRFLLRDEIERGKKAGISPLGAGGIANLGTTYSSATEIAAAFQSAALQNPAAFGEKSKEQLDAEKVKAANEALDNFGKKLREVSFFEAGFEARRALNQMSNMGPQ